LHWSPELLARFSFFSQLQLKLDGKFRFLKKIAMRNGSIPLMFEVVEGGTSAEKRVSRTFMDAPSVRVIDSATAFKEETELGLAVPQGLKFGGVTMVTASVGASHTGMTKVDSVHAQIYP
jgi:hypothetical protein